LAIQKERKSAKEDLIYAAQTGTGRVRERDAGHHLCQRRGAENPMIVERASYVGILGSKADWETCHYIIMKCKPPEN